LERVKIDIDKKDEQKHFRFSSLELSLFFHLTIMDDQDTSRSIYLESNNIGNRIEIAKNNSLFENYEINQDHNSSKETFAMSVVLLFFLENLKCSLFVTLAEICATNSLNCVSFTQL
jgi:hypothetical protein